MLRVTEVAELASSVNNQSDSVSTEVRVSRVSYFSRLVWSDSYLIVPTSAYNRRKQNIMLEIVSEV